MRHCLVLATALMLLGIGASGHAETPAASAWFEIPPGFSVAADDEVADGGEWAGLAIVQPPTGPFAELSSIRLRAVAGRVSDADAWLEARLIADPAARGSGGPGFLDSPDSPFADPSFDGIRNALPALLRGLGELGRLPLEFCDNPTDGTNRAGGFRELRCTFALGPFKQFVILRLQEADGRWYYTNIRAMNERRLRELLAIAETFTPQR